MYPDQVSLAGGLYAGQCGWLTCGMKDASQGEILTTIQDHPFTDTQVELVFFLAILGDTFYDPMVPSTEIEPISKSIETRQSMVYASLYPVDSSGFDKLAEAIDQVRHSCYNCPAWYLA